MNLGYGLQCSKILKNIRHLFAKVTGLIWEDFSRVSRSGHFEGMYCLHRQGSSEEGTSGMTHPLMQCHIPQDQNPKLHSSENLKTCKVFFFFTHFVYECLGNVSSNVTTF